MYPGRYDLARFQVEDTLAGLHIDVVSRDGSVALSVTARTATTMTGGFFSSVDDATGFFRAGHLGYSPGPGPGCFSDGVALLSERWDAEAMTVDHMSSSLFDNKAICPPGSCTLDSALVMRDLPVRWASQGQIAGRSTADVG